MLEINIINDLDRIKKLLLTDNIGQLMAQYDDAPFLPLDNGTYNYIVISDNGEDVGLYILEVMAVHNHFTVHLGFVKKFRGANVFIATNMFIDLMRALFTHATLWATPPLSKLPALKVAQRAGFELLTIIPGAIATGDRNKPTFIDQAVLILKWNNA